MNIPENVNNLIRQLEQSGYKAYAVGGCVRDSLLGRTPKDWDICTSALPDRIKAVFSGDRVLETGIKHGTVTVLRGEPYEITTFRLDGEYTDCRRPDSVEFTADVVQDLARRDFTINAIAYSPTEGIIDPFGGRRDIEAKIIRTVGKAEQRFGEDALRILRGLRFGITLGFETEAKTAAAMLSCRKLIGRISAERVREELVKSLLGGSVKASFIRFREIVAEVIPQMRPCFDFPQQTKHHSFNVYEHMLTAADSCRSDDAAVKLALLLHDIAKPKAYRFYGGSAHFKGHSVYGVRTAEEALKGLRFDNKTVKKALALIRFHDVRLTGGTAQLLKLSHLVGDETMPDLFEVMRADTLAQSDYMRAEKLRLIDLGKERFEWIRKNNICRSLSDLQIDGTDAVQTGFCGRATGAALNAALNAVMSLKVKNERECLMKYLNDFYCKIKASEGGTNS